MKSMSVLQGLTDARAATMEQLALDLDQTPAKALLCEHRHYKAAIDRVWCDKGAGFYTMCGLPFCGELAGCAYDEPDNSPEAMERRRAWAAANE
jgi:hypothetical protein